MTAKLVLSGRYSECPTEDDKVVISYYASVVEKINSGEISYLCTPSFSTTDREFLPLRVEFTEDDE